MDQTIPKKRGRPAKIKEELSIPVIDIQFPTQADVIRMYNPIVFILQVNGNTIHTQVANVLKALKEIKIVPNTIKTVSVLHFEYQGKTYHRIFRVMQMKMLLGSEARKIMVAKIINLTLGLPYQ